MQLPRLFRRPVVHFLLLGGLLFLAQGWLPRAADTIRVSAADVERLRQDWRRDTGHAPSDVQLQASTRRWLEDEALLREALRLGLDQRDAVARRRLLMNLRFAFPETALDDASLLREAEALEMQQSDLVARRRLIQAMEQRLLGELQWSEQELRDYVAAHPERYAGAVRYSFRQVFLAPERTPRQAQQLLTALRAGVPGATGDAFLLGENFKALAPDEITRQFGPALAQALAAASPGQWSGPVASPYGNHLLLLERREAAASIDYTSVRRQAAYALLAEREALRLAQARARLLRQYRVEPGPGVETVS